MNRSRSSTAHIQVPVPPRLPDGWTFPSMRALRRAPLVLNPQYAAAAIVVR